MNAIRQLKRFSSRPLRRSHFRSGRRAILLARRLQDTVEHLSFADSEINVSALNHYLSGGFVREISGHYWRFHLANSPGNSGLWLLLLAFVGSVGGVLLTTPAGLPGWAGILIAMVGVYGTAILASGKYIASLDRKYAYSLLLQQLIDARAALQSKNMLKSRDGRSLLLRRIEVASAGLTHMGHLSMEGSKDNEFKTATLLQFRGYAASLSDLRSQVVAPQVGTRDELIRRFNSMIAAVVDQTYGDLPCTTVSSLGPGILKRIRNLAGAIVASVLLIGGGVLVQVVDSASDAGVPDKLTELGLIMIIAGLIPFFRLLGVDLGQLLGSARGDLDGD